MSETMVLVDLILGGFFSLVTEIAKRYGVTLNPLLIAASLSLLGGVLYATMIATGTWSVFALHAGVAFSGAVAIYEVVSKVGKTLEKYGILPL